MQDEKKTPKKFAFLGYEIGGWGALLAFVISIVTLLLTATDRWFLDSNPVLRFPEIVNFTCQGWYTEEEKEICPSYGKLFVEANPVTLINDTSAPHSYTAIRSEVELDFHGNDSESKSTISLDWFYFGDSDPIAPISVPPQSSISNEIDYYARRSFDKNGELVTRDFLLFSQFEKMIGTGDIKKIKMTFWFDLLNGERIKASCFVPIDNDFIMNAKKKEFVFYYRECFELDPTIPAES